MLVLGLVSVLTVQAQAPAEMSYQGYLEDGGTKVNDANATLTFRLLDGGASIVWTETHTGVDVQDGLFEVLLGSQTALTGYEFFEALTLEVDYAGTSLGPRAPLTASPYALGLHLPLVAEAPVGGTALLVHNTSENGDGIKGETQAQTGRGVFGQASSLLGENAGVYGFSRSAAGRGVYGLANTSVATDPNFGVYGRSNSDSGYGVYGVAPKVGVYGTATSDAIDAFGVRGNAGGSSTAVYGRASGSGAGVFGHNIGTGRGGRFEINNTGNSSNALFAWTNGTGAAGHFQIANGGSSAYALEAITNGTGAAGHFQIANGGSSAHTLEAITNGSGAGLYAEGGAFGVRATASTVFGVGVSGETGIAAGIGVRGLATAPSSITYGVLAESASEDGYGLRAKGGKYGVYAEPTVEGGFSYPDQLVGATAGIYARAFPNAQSESGNFAGIFDGSVWVLNDIVTDGGLFSYGRVTIDNTLNADELDVSGTKNFKIDHPLDPANKYLYHFAVESSEVLNVYSGNVTTDGEGYAEVTLPDWFEALNIDFRYQLTVVWQFAQAIIAETIRDNRFVIRTDAPHVEVSWQVTGVRNDPGLRMRDRPVEQDKPPAQRGTYVSPEAYGQGPSPRSR